MDKRVELTIAFFLCLRALTKLRTWRLPVGPASWSKALRLSLFLPLLLVKKWVGSIHQSYSYAKLLMRGAFPSGRHIDELTFADQREFRRVLDRIGNSGPRLTGNEAHEKLIDWLEDELRLVPGLSIQTESIDLLRWRPRDDKSLRDIARLEVDGALMSLAGAVPYCLPTIGNKGDLEYVPGGAVITNELRGKIVLRDFPSKSIPYALGRIPSYTQTIDLGVDTLNMFDRPGLADQPLHEDLLAAGRVGVAGVVFMFDLPREQVESYFDPHKGTHYQVPAVYVGIEEAIVLKKRATQRARASMSIDAEVLKGRTRSLIATLPGQIQDRMVYVTHTDGNTFVQENGSVALLALARYFATLSLSSRRHTLQFAFNTGHLHISREDTYKHAVELDASFEKESNLSLIIPIEHLGAREIEAFPRKDGQPGRELNFTSRGEVMFWCTGPSPSVVEAVKNAVHRRNLDRVLITRGVSIPTFKSVPTFTSFGGIGTYYHNMLLPTTSLISGPWSLWAPSFGAEAVDVERLRQQTLALGDIYMSLDHLEREVIVGDYAGYRRWRANGGKTVSAVMPPETAEDVADRKPASKGTIVY